MLTLHGRKEVAATRLAEAEAALGAVDLDDQEAQARAHDARLAAQRDLESIDLAIAEATRKQREANVAAEAERNAIALRTIYETEAARLEATHNAEVAAREYAKHAAAVLQHTSTIRSAMLAIGWRNFSDAHDLNETEGRLSCMLTTLLMKLGPCPRNFGKVLLPQGALKPAGDSFAWRAFEEELGRRAIEYHLTEEQRT